MQNPKASLIISFYNNFNFLELVLAGLERQTLKRFEIIIADDGSTEEVKNKIKNYKQGTDLNIKHVWHEDLGWRKNKILNKAIIESESDYIIFIDGDCIPHERFIEDHFKNGEKNKILAGRRVNVSEKLTKKLTYDFVKKGRLIFFDLLFDSIIGDSRDVEKGLRIGYKPLRNIFNKSKRGVLGCNFSLHKSCLLGVNGFDERYINPAVGEDTDIERRLLRNGLTIKTIKFAGIQYHLYHKKLERKNYAASMKILEANDEAKVTYTPYGIEKTKKLL